MKNHYDVIDLIIPIIKVSDVTDLIDGDVYPDKKPTNSELINIVITALPLNFAPNRDTQEGIFHILIFCKNLDNGLPNNVVLRSIAEQIVLKMEAYKQTSGTFHLFELENERIFPYPEQKQLSFLSIRLRAWIEQ